MSKLVLIDGNAILHRAYHALPPLSLPDGRMVNAVYGFVSMLLRVIQDLKPRYITVAFDTAKPTFRHTEYVGYQAHRPRTDSSLSGQFETTYKVLDAMNIPIFFLPGYEADDVIGTLATQAVESKEKNYQIDEIVIVTGDRDILQLVNKKIKVYMPIKGLTEAKIFEEKDVLEKMGVLPSKIVDFKALVGDPSDNYPGVPGIGPKTAVGLLEKFGNLENIYDNLVLIPEKVSRKLAEGAESAGLSKKLATIICDAPVTLNIKSAADWNIARKEAIETFSELGFKSLKERVVNLSKELN